MKAAEEAGCYKVILDCSEENVPFYAKCGLTKKEVQMVSCWDGWGGRPWEWAWRWGAPRLAALNQGCLLVWG